MSGAIGNDSVKSKKAVQCLTKSVTILQQSWLNHPVYTSPWISNNNPYLTKTHCHHKLFNRAITNANDHHQTDGGIGPKCDVLKIWLVIKEYLCWEILASYSKRTKTRCHITVKPNSNNELTKLSWFHNS